MTDDKRLAQPHTCSIEDWEDKMEKLFWAAVHPFHQGLAIFTNTERRYTGDPEGQLIPRVSMRIKKEQSADMKQFLKGLTREGFNKVFGLKDTPPEGPYEFLKLVDTALPNNSYVYFIHSVPPTEKMGTERVDMERERQAILVYSPINTNLDFMRIITAINDILNPEEKEDKKDESGS